MNKPFSKQFALLLGLFFSHSALGINADAGDEVSKLGDIADDYYAAGGKVNIEANIEGDVVAAGGRLSIDSSISEDLIAAGGYVTVRGSIRDDLRVAGGNIEIAAEVGDDLIAAGGNVSIGESTTVNGTVHLAGGSIKLAGAIQGNVTVAAATLEISGTIDGNLEYMGDRIELLDKAIVKGDLNYQSPNQASVAADATILGAINHEEKDWERSSRDFGLLSLLTFVVAVTVFLLVFPNYAVGSARRIGAEPLKSAGAGFLLLVLTPILAILSMSLVLGIWVGLTLLAFYAVALLTSYLIGCVFVGDWGAKRLNQDASSRGRIILAATLAIVLLKLISALPLVGNLLIFLLLVAGLGAGAMQINAIYRREPAHLSK